MFASRRRLLRPGSPPTVVLAAVAVVGLVSACSSTPAPPTRTVENFCATYTSEKAQFQSRYSSIGSGGSDASGTEIMTDLFLGLQSLGDVTVILTKLDAVAPDDIEPDVAAVLDSWKSMQETLGDEAGNAFNPTGLAGTILKGLLASAMSQGSWTRLGDYIETNCTSGS